MRAPFGLTLIFLNVLLEQLGLPLPAVPTLVVAGAVAANGQLPLAAVFALAVGASFIGDSSWYLAGRTYGVRVMKLLCRISLTPDTCVSQTQASFERWGARALVAAKFIPGLSMIAPPLAGATHMRFARFAVFSVAGSALWVAAALAAGILLREQVARLLPRLSGIGGTVVILILVLLAAYIGFKWWERKRFYAALEMARIDVDELYRRMQGDTAPVIVDVRSATAQELERRRIPGALAVPVQEVERHVRSLPRDREIILYCSCPNEASAAQAAKLLQRNGFRLVRPLRGGLEAWIAAGYAVEELPASAASAASEALTAPPLR
ncbi:MAG: DedA family protein/thiosulfate sulfurtransferase GlpE [Gammaproteobacteria bacterium]|nr:DedA family protein/thiosulfate sulfurtransferase GlpE [Gammaproteobacteria bacterium]MBV8403749.1 DedA family protein/thiosulfate sulfurtransferase GlpE [Gammaproteobacteria bacterium]